MNPTDDSNANLPQGYIMQTASDGTMFAVPAFLIPAAHSAFDAHKMKDLQDDVYPSEVITGTSRRLAPTNIGGGSVVTPVNPSLSKQERLQLLAEAKALQARYGITLKDACHRLYLAEVAKLEAIDTAEKTLAFVRRRIDKTMDDEIRLPIEQIDKGAFDEYIVPCDNWPKHMDDDAEGTVEMDIV